jgi:hypothetical protein
MEVFRLTKEKLSQLHMLNREAERLKARIQELELSATTNTLKITGLPKTKDLSDTTGEFAAELSDLKALYEKKLQECLREYDRLNRYILGISDCEVRMILSARYVDCQNWTQVAASISKYATEDSVRKIHDRFLQKTQNLSDLSA